MDHAVSNAVKGNRHSLTLDFYLHGKRRAWTSRNPSPMREAIIN